MMHRKILLLIASIFVIVPTFAEGEFSGSLDNNGTLAIFDPEGDGSGDPEGNGTGFSDAELGGLIAGVAAAGGMLAYGAFKKRAKIKSLLVAGKDAVVSGVTATGRGIASGVRATGRGIVAGARGTLRFAVAPFKMAAEASSRTYAATKEKLSTWNENRQIKNIASMDADIAKRQAKVDALRAKAKNRAAAKAGYITTPTEEQTAAAIKIQSVVRMRQAQKQAQTLRAKLSRPSLPPSTPRVDADASAGSVAATPPKTRTPLSTSFNSKMLAAARLTPQSRADVTVAEELDDTSPRAASGVGKKRTPRPLVATVEPDSPDAVESPTPEQSAQRKAEADAAVAQAKPRRLGATALAVAKLQPKPKADPDVVEESAPDGILSGSRPPAILPVVKDDAPEPTDPRSVARVDGVADAAEDGSGETGDLTKRPPVRSDAGAAEDDSGDRVKPPVKAPVRIEVEAKPKEVAAAAKKKAAMDAKMQARGAAATKPTGTAEAPDEAPAVVPNYKAELAATRAAQAEKRKNQKAAASAARRTKASSLAAQYEAERAAALAAADSTEEPTAAPVATPKRVDSQPDDAAPVVARSNVTVGPNKPPAPIPVTAPLERAGAAGEDDAASPTRTAPAPAPAPAPLKPLSVSPPPVPAASPSLQRTAPESGADITPSLEAKPTGRQALTPLKIPDASATSSAARSVAAGPAASPAVDDRTAAFKQSAVPREVVTGSTAASSSAVRGAFTGAVKPMPPVEVPLSVRSARSAGSLSSRSASFREKGVASKSTATQLAFDDDKRPSSPRLSASAQGLPSPRVSTSRRVEGKRTEAKKPLSALSVSSVSIASSSPRSSGSVTPRSPRSGESPGYQRDTKSSQAKQVKPAAKPQTLRRTQSAKLDR